MLFRSLLPGGWKRYREALANRRLDTAFASSFRAASAPRSTVILDPVTTSRAYNTHFQPWYFDRQRMETWARIVRLKDEAVLVVEMIRDLAHALFEFALAAETREVSPGKVGKSLARVPLHSA